MLLLALLFSLMTGQLRAAVSPEPLLVAAGYYFDHQDFRQSLQLYLEVLRRQPSSLTAVMRVAELKLMYDGRQAGRDTLLGFLSARNDLLSSESRRLMRDKVDWLANFFLTDDGQTAYLQAMVEIKDQGCHTGLPLLAQAAALEVGNTRVLKAKARCERILGALHPFQETLKLAFDSDPFDYQLAESLSEADIYFGQYDRVVDRYHLAPELLRSPRSRMAFAVALEESGKWSEAFPRLQALLGEQKLGVVHPMLLFALGRAGAQRADTLPEARVYLERFVAAVAPPEIDGVRDNNGKETAGKPTAGLRGGPVKDTLIDGWDPYRSEERLADARALLQSSGRGNLSH